MSFVRFILRLLAIPAAVGLIAAAGGKGLHLANLDRTCAPCDDFYRFATGGWQKAETIPPGHASWGCGATSKRMPSHGRWLRSTSTPTRGCA
jgi:hypothetical protein